MVSPDDESLASGHALAGSRRIPVRALRRTFLIGLAIALLLTGCVTSAKVSEYLHVQPERESRIIIEPGDAIVIIPAESADCLRDSLLQAHPTLRMVSPDDFRRAAFPDQPADDVAFAYPIPESQQKLLATQTFRDRIAPLHLRYLVSVGEQEEKFPLNTMRPGDWTGIMEWRTTLTMRASVIDLKDGRAVESIEFHATGDKEFGFLFVPIFVRVEIVRRGPVCKALGERLGNFLAGRDPISGPSTSAPSEDASAAYQRGDFATALRLFRARAEHGDATAQTALGRMYELGVGTSADSAEAAKWFHQAAKQGDADAQNKLGDMYRNGEGVPQDSVQAYMWFTLAATCFPASETEKRDKAIKDREEVAAKLTVEQIAEAERLAREWRPE